jgi:hypothetical protein
VSVLTGSRPSSEKLFALDTPWATTEEAGLYVRGDGLFCPPSEDVEAATRRWIRSRDHDAFVIRDCGIMSRIHPVRLVDVMSSSYECSLFTN